MPRLFVALDLPDEVKRSLTPMMRGLGDVHWVADDQQHLTLRFIGEVDNGRANEIADALALVPGEPFDLQLKGIGHFPPRGEPRILWAGVSKSTQLHALRKRIERGLRLIDLEPEARKYSPHVTLARLRQPPNPASLATYLMRHSLYRSPPFPVSGFKLYSSWLRPEGPDYQVEASYDLLPGVDEDSLDGSYL